ncbi:MAG TPA: hypothetical protein VF657_11125, partial [Actinoplanes sp.]
MTAGVNGRVAVPAQRTVGTRSEHTSGELPAVVHDIDLSAPLPTIAAVHTDGRRVVQAWLLV